MRLRTTLPWLLLAFALRLIAAESRALWYDDAFSVFLAERSWGDIVRGTAADTMPPLYYFTLRLWMGAVGQSPLTLRLLNGGVTMAAVALGIVLARRLFGTRVAGIAAPLLAVNPFLIYHAQELRMYGWLLLGLALYSYGVARWLLRPAGGAARRWPLAAGVGALIALYSHPLAPLSLLAPLGWLLWQRRGRDILRLALVVGLAGLGYSPWLLAFLPGQVAKVQRAFWTQPPSLLDAVQLPLIWLTNLPLPGWLLPIALFVALGLLLLLLYSSLRLPDDGARSFLWFAIGVPLLAMALLSYALQPIFVPRGAIFATVAFALLVAWLVARLPTRPLRGGAVALLLLFTAPALAYHYQYADFIRSPYDQLVAELRPRLAAGEWVIHDNKVPFFPAHFYDRALPQRFLPDVPGSGNDSLAPASMEAMQLFPTPRRELAALPSFWFVAYERDLEPGESLTNVGWLSAERERLEEFRVGGLRVIHFGAKKQP